MRKLKEIPECSEPTITAKLESGQIIGFRLPVGIWHARAIKAIGTTGLGLLASITPPEDEEARGEWIGASNALVANILAVEEDQLCSLIALIGLSWHPSCGYELETERNKDLVAYGAGVWEELAESFRTAEIYALVVTLLSQLYKDTKLDEEVAELAGFTAPMSVGRT